MNKKKRGVALIIVLAFLLTVCTLTYIVLVMFENQNRITRSYMSLDESRYALERGARHGFWVWRYHYDTQVQGTVYQITLPINGYNVNSVDVRIEDINNNRRLDEGELLLNINKVSW